VVEIELGADQGLMQGHSCGSDDRSRGEGTSRTSNSKKDLKEEGLLRGIRRQPGETLTILSIAGGSRAWEAAR